MTRSFIAANSEYIQSDLCITTVPLSLSAWFKPKNITADHSILGCYSSSGDLLLNAFYLVVPGAGPNNFQAIVSGPGGFRVSSATPVSANIWQHGGGVFTSDSERLAYYNGVAGTVNTESFTPTGIIRTTSGAFLSLVSNIYATADVCELGIWNVALTANEMAALAAGATCNSIRPGSLLGYWLPLGKKNLSNTEAENFGAFNNPMYVPTRSSARQAVDEPFLVYKPNRIWRKLSNPFVLVKN
jgi:hypothetical protein